MNRRGFLGRMALAVAASAMFNVTWPAKRDTAVRAGDGWSLARAINEARPGDVIVVPPAAYYTDEPMVLRKGATLIMYGSDIVSRHPGLTLDLEKGSRYQIHGNLFRFEAEGVAVRRT